MADHRLAHPVDIPGCFGCHCYGIGFDGKHLTRKTVIRRDNTGKAAGFQVEHRDGRQDAAARPESVHVTIERSGR